MRTIDVFVGQAVKLKKETAQAYGLDPAKTYRITIAFSVWLAQWLGAT